MKIVIANGTHEADYIIEMYKSFKNHLIVINKNEEVCKYLASKNGISVICGDPTKQSDLQGCEIENADLFIALSQNDVDNYVACKMAKKMFNVNKCIATVINPKNVELFRKLDIDSVVSSTYLLAEKIKNQTTVENLINTLSIENDKIVILEILIKETSHVRGKTLSEINISSIASVSCVYRYSNVIIPNGATKLEAGDKVLVVTTEENKENIISLFKR